MTEPEVVYTSVIASDRNVIPKIPQHIFGVAEPDWRSVGLYSDAFEYQDVNSGNRRILKGYVEQLEIINMCPEAQFLHSHYVTASDYLSALQTIQS